MLTQMPQTWNHLCYASPSLSPGLHSQYVHLPQQAASVGQGEGHRRRQSKGPIELSTLLRKQVLPYMYIYIYMCVIYIYMHICIVSVFIVLRHRSHMGRVAPA